MCFNEDWRYQFTLSYNFCLLELIYVALGHLDELQKAESIPVGGRYRQVSLYWVSQTLYACFPKLYRIDLLAMEQSNYYLCASKVHLNGTIT